MGNTTCSVLDVSHSEGRLIRGMCNKHYQRYMNAKRPCKYDGCGNGGASRDTGYCQTHHRRLMKHGSPSVTMKGKAHKVQYTDAGLRICKVCGDAKPPSEYHKDTGGTDGLRAQCKPCRNGYMESYYHENRDQRLAYERDRRRTQADHLRAWDRKRYRRDREKRIALASENTRLRRARLVGVLTEPGVTVANLRKIHGDNCCYCSVKMDFQRGVRGDGIAPNRATLEHVVPITRGGSHTFINTALACHSCNVSKNDKTVEEWEAWKAGELYGRKKATTPGKGCERFRGSATAVLF